MREDEHQAGREEAQDVYLGTDIGVVDAEGAPVTRQVGGGDRAGETRLGPASALRGGTTRRRVLRDGQPAFEDTIDETRSGPTGTTTRRGREVRAGDARAMAQDLRDQLIAERRAEEARFRQDNPYEIDVTGGHRARMDALQADIDRLAAVRATDDPTVVEEVARRHNRLVAPRDRVAQGEVTTRETGLDRDALGEGRLRARDATSTERTTDDRVERQSDERASELDLRNGRASHGRSQSHTVTTTHEDGSQTERRNTESRSTTVTVNNGVRVEMDASHGSSSLERRDRTGPDQSGTVESNQRGTNVRVRQRAGVVADQNGWGATRGSTTRVEATEGETTASDERSRDVTVRENGVAREASRERELRHGNATFGRRVSTDQSFTIDIERQNDETPPRYRLVFTIHLGVAARLSARRQRENGRGLRASAQGEASASGDLVLRRVLSEEQAQQYWDEAQRVEREGQRGGQARAVPSQLPEFSRLARLRAAAANGGQIANAGAAIGDAGSARNMNEGDETELTLTGRVAGEGNVGYRGEGYDVGAGVGASEERTRRVLVARVGAGDQARVRVTVTYQRAGDVSANASGGVGGTSVSVDRRWSEGDGDSVRFTLDPRARDFDARYARIVRTTSREALLALAQAPAFQQSLDYRETTREDGTEGNERVSGAGGLGVGVRRTGQYRERVRRGRDGSLSGQVHGSQDTSLQVRNDDGALLQGGNEGSVDATVERDGQMDITLQERTHDSDPLRAAREERERREALTGEEALRDRLGATPSARLRRVLDQEYSTLRGFHLDAGDIDVVIGRARDRARWEQCASSPRMLADWQALRIHLLRPRTDAQEARLDPVVAARLAVCRHLARFYQAHGQRAQTAMHNVLRNWGAAGFAGASRDSSAAAVGAEFEWPHTLRQHQRTFETIRAEVRDLERAAQGQATQGDVGERTAEQRYARAEALHARLAQIYSAVAAANDYSSEGARAGLLRFIDGHLLRLRELRIRHRQADRGATTETPVAQTPTTPGARPSVASQAASRERGPEPDAGARELARAQIRSIIARLRGYKAREQAQLRRANELSYTVRGRVEATTICGQLQRMAQVWYDDVRDLRRAYQTAAVPTSAWEVSQQGGRRSRELEPEMGWLVEIYRRASDPRGDNGVARSARWLQQFRTY